MNCVNMLIKPVSGLCNLRCRYCFYDDVTTHRAKVNMGVMSEDMLELVVQEAFAAVHPGGRVSFAFQGGEPTLAGLNFFRKFISMEEKLCPSYVLIEHAIQTNGILLDEEWASFLKKNHFLVGLSLDGMKELHDLNRVDFSNNGTHSKVVRALKLLQKYNVDTNILCVITGQCARHYKEVYQTLKQSGCRYLQFIPCLDPFDSERGGMPFSLKPEAYAQFLCGLFDLWYQDWKNNNYVSIRLFDDYVHLLVGNPPGTCATIGQCGSYFVIEGNGAVYPCDFYVLDRWRMGTLGEKSLNEMRRSPAAIAFQEENKLKPQACGGCQWMPLCNGGCKRDRWLVGGAMKNYYCDAFQKFFTFAGSRLRKIALVERSMLNALEMKDDAVKNTYT